MKDKRDIELKALMEVTQAINSNMAAEDLYKVFYFICISLLRLSKVSLYVCENGEVVEKFSKSLSLVESELQSIVSSEFKIDLQEFSSNDGWSFFPARHKQKLLAFLVVKNEATGETGTSSDSFLKTLTNLIMVAIENKRLARRALIKERDKREAEIARGVQASLVPSKLPKNNLFEASSVYLPHQSVGGDYYDVIKLTEEDYLFCIADVSGKGVPAALIMSNFQATLRALARFTDNLEVLIKDLNMHLNQNAASDHFVTCFLAIYNHSSRNLRYVNAGHNPPYLFSSNGQFQKLEKGCLMLGALPEIPFLNLGKVYIGTSSPKLFMFTDGITETMNPEGEEFGEDRLEAFLKETSDQDLKINLANLIVDIDLFKQEGAYHDDLTLLSVKFF